MIGCRAKVKTDFQSVAKKARRANINSLGRAAAILRLDARHSIRSSKKPSLPGQPPRTKTKRLRNAILFYNDKAAERAYIGPAATITGPVGGAHEFGTNYHGRKYPMRAFMGPALTRITPRLPEQWAGAIR